MNDIDRLYNDISFLKKQITSMQNAIKLLSIKKEEKPTSNKTLIIIVVSFTIGWFIGIVTGWLINYKG